MTKPFLATHVCAIVRDHVKELYPEYARLSTMMLNYEHIRPMAHGPELVEGIFVTVFGEMSAIK